MATDELWCNVWALKECNMYTLKNGFMPKVVTRRMTLTVLVCIGYILCKSTCS